MFVAWHSHHHPPCRLVLSRFRLLCCSNVISCIVTIVMLWMFELLSLLSHTLCVLLVLFVFLLFILQMSCPSHYIRTLVTMCSSSCSCDLGWRRRTRYAIKGYEARTKYPSVPTCFPRQGTSSTQSCLNMARVWSSAAQNWSTCSRQHQPKFGRTEIDKTLLSSAQFGRNRPNDWSPVLHVVRRMRLQPWPLRTPHRPTSMSNVVVSWALEPKWILLGSRSPRCERRA